MGSVKRAIQSLSLPAADSSLYTKEPWKSDAPICSLHKVAAFKPPFLSKGRWHEVPEGISYGFIRFIGGNADILRNTLSGLRFCLLIYVLVNSRCKIRALRGLLVSPRFDGERARQSLSHAAHGSSLYTKEPPLSLPFDKKGRGIPHNQPPCANGGIP